MCTQLEGIQKGSYLKPELPIKTSKTALNTKIKPWTLTFDLVSMPQFHH